MTGRKGYIKPESERIGALLTSVGLNKNHRDWLVRHPLFNLSQFVREGIDKLISEESEGIMTPKKGEKEKK